MKIQWNMARPIDILLVEDNPVDAMIVKETFNKWKVPNNLHITRNGEDAMDFLLKHGKYASAPSPEIIFLDLNLPRMDGREVLAKVKGDKTLRHIPIIILTTSENENDISKSYQLQANCFITKPADMKQFSKSLENLGEFWVTQVRLPTYPKPYSATDIQSVHLLLVEDNPVDALHLKVMLDNPEGVKFTISRAATLNDAKNCLSEENIDIVTLDLGLPDSRGLETFLEIQKSAPDLPIIVISGLDDESLAITAVKNGAQDYLIKDKLNSQLLVRSIRYAIQRHQLLSISCQANRALQESEQRFRAIFEGAGDYISIKDSNLRYILVNPALSRLLGKEPSDLIGLTAKDIYGFSEASQLMQLELRALQGNLGRRAHRHD